MEKIPVFGLILYGIGVSLFVCLFVALLIFFRGGVRTIPKKSS